MTNAIIDGTNIDVNVLSYSAPKANPSGGKVVNLYNKYVKESLTISTPLILTWGAQEGMDQQKNPTGKYTMSLQFPNTEYPNADCDAFLDNLRKLEQKIKSDALTYSKEWFGKTITSSDVMDEKFNIMLRHPKKEKGSAELDYNKPPTVTVKIPCWKGVWQSEIYDEDGEPLFIKGKSATHLSPLDFLKPKTHVICLIQCGGLWFVNGKVSITWNLKQAIVQKPKTSYITEGTCFLRIKPAEKEKLKTLPPPEDEIDPDGAITTTIVEDSDDDERELPIIPVPLPVVVQTTQVVEQVLLQEPAVVAAEEPKKKRVISKKLKVET
uniref:Uncharacterized protein n=1 Tax=viral metagenome TaxID=1070528 RepID=A0A6C0ICW2_9ZZZZ